MYGDRLRPFEALCVLSLSLAVCEEPRTFAFELLNLALATHQTFLSISKRLLQISAALGVA